MLAPPRSPQRYPAPPSPSRSLIGMENVVPPRARSSTRSPFSPAADVNKPLPPRTRPSSRSPCSPAPDKDKPLPERPGSISSVYTADSGCTRIIDTYSNHSCEEEQPIPSIIQPIAYQQTISALLRRRLDEPPSPKSVPSEMSIDTLASQIWPHSHQFSPDSPAISAVSAPSASDSRNAPSFKEFSRNLRNKKTYAVEAVSPPFPSPQASPHFRAISYESTRRTPSISPRTSDVVDLSLMPAPLFVSKNRNTVVQGRLETNNMYVNQEVERSQSRFSSSDDSYVIYTGVRESVRAYLRHKMQKKRDSSKKERERVMSVASTKYPGMLTAKEYDRRFSSTSRKASVQQGIASVYGKLSKLSISGSSGQSKEEKTQPRGRKKQLAIPTSAYQKYGAAVWEAPKRQKKAKRGSAPPKTLMKKSNDGRSERQSVRHPSMSAKPAEVVGAFKSGRSQIIHALDDTRHKLKRSESEKRREALKQSIKLVGPADEVSDGVMSYRI